LLGAVRDISDIQARPLRIRKPRELSPTEPPTICPMRRLALPTALIIVAALATAPAPAAKPHHGHPQLDAKAKPIDGKLRRQITGSSWHQGCPVPRSKLRLVVVNHWDFHDKVDRGRLIVKKSMTSEIVGAMRSLYRQHFPIRRMELVDRYGADDHRSMNADNTSAFNCREIAGQPGVWSQHAYGRAIDLNPRENPYVTASGYVSPPAGAPYADRSRHSKGMVHRGDRAFKTFKRVGWEWGGDWSYPKDYQHFSANGH
jgi:hypothetical protein